MAMLNNQRVSIVFLQLMTYANAYRPYIGVEHFKISTVAIRLSLRATSLPVTQWLLSGWMGSHFHSYSMLFTGKRWWTNMNHYEPIWTIFLLIGYYWIYPIYHKVTNISNNHFMITLKLYRIFCFIGIYHIISCGFLWIPIPAAVITMMIWWRPADVGHFLSMHVSQSLQPHFQKFPNLVIILCWFRRCSIHILQMISLPEPSFAHRSI